MIYRSWVPEAARRASLPRTFGYVSRRLELPADGDDGSVYVRRRRCKGSAAEAIHGPHRGTAMCFRGHVKDAPGCRICNKMLKAGVVKPWQK